MTKTQAWVIIQDELMKLDKPDDYDELGVAKFYILDNTERHRLQIFHDEHLIVEVEYDSALEGMPEWN